MNSEVPTPEYLETLKLYYEEEVEGEAYFAEIADRLADTDQKEKMMLMAEVENYAAAAVVPLLVKHNLTPRATNELVASGRSQAQKNQDGWPELVASMQKTFPAYINDFERLEAMAPPADLPTLKILTAHEVAAIKFLELEAVGDKNSTAPMRHYLETGQA